MEARVQEILKAKLEAAAQEEAERRFAKLQYESKVNSDPRVRDYFDTRADLNYAPESQEDRNRLYESYYSRYDE